MSKMNTFYGFKIGQSQDFDSAGHRVPVTSVRVDPVTVVGTKNTDKNGYNAWQIALGTKKHPNKPLQGLLRLSLDKLGIAQDKSSKTSGKITPRYIREIKISENDQKNVGEKVQIADIFSAGDTVNITGTSKGKGFAGVVKRHHFHGGPKTHGQSDRARHPGSIGAGTTPGRIYKGKRMAGHLGNVQKTVTKLRVFAVKPEENLLAIQGLVPGPKGGLLKITKLPKLPRIPRKPKYEIN